MIEIIPAILTPDSNIAKEMIKLCEDVVDRVQIDIIDGIFSKNKTIDPSAVEDIDTNLNLDFHLMTKEPTDWVERVFRAGADRIIAQIEMMGSQFDFVGKVGEVGAGVGLALDINTPVDQLDLRLLTNLDVVLLMGVPAGFGGQKFDRSVLAKIKELKEIKLRDGADFKICVDGGETESVIDESHFSGADEAVIGKKLFDGSLAQNIERFQKAAHIVS